MAKKMPSKTAAPAKPEGMKLVSPEKAPVSIPLLAVPPAIERPKSIHPRNLLQLVPEGAERNVHSVTREISFEARALAPLAAGDEIKLRVNTELSQPAQSRTASNVGEPSCAISDQTVLYTGNWYAAISADGGATFRFMNPAAAFPTPLRSLNSAAIRWRTISQRLICLCGCCNTAPRRATTFSA